MKAAQSISQEIELDKLLATLMQTLITSTGAQTGYLILRIQDDIQDGWFVVIEANSEQIKMLEIPLEDYPELPRSLVYSVTRAQETEVFANLSQAAQFLDDSYIIKNQPKSALCSPISQQGKLIGILYLENNLTIDAFTSDRLQIIQLLTTQAAISLKNAQLYSQLESYSQQLEQKVDERTQELRKKATQLESTLQELHSKQMQFVQSEKMSTLGQLVAGIAHEINNPVNFIHGNINYVKDYTQKLLSVVNNYKELNPNQVSIEKILDGIDLDFIQEDLPKILQSMVVGTQRIREIVLSLRTFSRMDEAEIKEVDIHEGIDSTLMILQHRLKETSGRCGIEVLKNYGQLPLIECYAGQLNQVFMNILSNAIDAIKEKCRILNNEQSRQIKICTSVVDALVEITIADSGIGMSSEMQQQMFNQFFTTKAVGKGTGMGMSISYQIIIEKHGGTLNCISTPNEGSKFIIRIPIYPKVSK